jgi:hypothetical protein
MTKPLIDSTNLEKPDPNAKPDRPQQQGMALEINQLTP